MGLQHNYYFFCPPAQPDNTLQDRPPNSMWNPPIVVVVFCLADIIFAILAREKAEFYRKNGKMAQSNRI
jgi:hypothetical protein